MSTSVLSQYRVALASRRRPGVLWTTGMIIAALAGGSAVGAQTSDELQPIRQAVVAGDVDNAIALLDALDAQYGETGALLLWRGHALKRAGDGPAATRLYLRVLELQPRNAGALIALGDLQVSASSLERALDYFGAAIDAAPRSPVGYRRAAGVEVQLGRHRDAVGHLQQYLELAPNDAAAFGVLGVEQYMAEDGDAAIVSLERSLELDPDRPGSHFGLGMVLADRPAHYDRALSHLGTALEAEPGNVMAHYLVGRIHFAEGRLEEARDALTASLELDSEQPDVHYRLALTYSRLGDRDTAQLHQQRFQELTRLADDATEHERQVGMLKRSYDIASTPDELEIVRARAESLDAALPDDPEVLMVLARLALREDDGPNALAYADRVVTLVPVQWEALLIRGLVLRQAGDRAAARTALEASRAINPLHAPTHNAMGSLLMDAGEVAAAVDAYRFALELEPDDAATYLNLAAAYGRLGEADLEADAMARYRALTQ